MMIRHSLALVALCLLAACTREPASEQPFPHAPVEVVTDVHGIPHIYAKSDADAFWAQGYVMAELRPSQSEHFRLWSQGRRAEVWGESKVTTDLAVRAFDFLGFAHRNWADFKKGWPDVAEAAEAFAAGFNDRYAEYAKKGWPNTLQVMIDAGWKPEPWDGPQVLAVSQLLGYGLAGSPDIKIELTLAKALLGPAVFNDLFRFNKPVTAVPVPDFFAEAGLKTAVDLQPKALNALQAEVRDALDGLTPEALEDAIWKARELNELRFSGSNSFAVAGDKMVDGVAVLESDTHQGLPIPGPYVLFHLISNRGPGATGRLDIIGSAFPGAPMVVFGHNGKVAWAPTVGFLDMADFYWEFFDPEKPDHVLRPGGKSVPTIPRSETFKIRQEDGSFRYQTVEVRQIPGHGPILPSEILPLPVPLKISMRWAGDKLPGPAPAVFNLAFAETLDGIFDTLRTLIGGTLGFGLATTENRIAYSWWTNLPNRNASGIFKPWFIIPGNEGPFWEGFVPHEYIPHSIDPEKGYLWAANSDPVGNTFDGDPGNDPYYLGFAYSLGYRGQRIDDLLSGLTKRGDVTMEELEEVQVDRYSGFAAQIVPFFADAVTAGRYPMPEALKPYAAAVTNGWDFHASGDSYEATIFYTWVYQFIADMMLDDYMLLDEVSGSNMPIFGPALMHWLRLTAPIIDGITDGSVPFPSGSGRNYFDNLKTPDHVETRDELIIEALGKAVDHLKATIGAGTNGDAAADPEDMTTWLWKRMLYLESRHMLADVDPSWEKYNEYRGVGGNVDTVNVGQFGAFKGGKLVDRYILNNAPSNRFFWRMEPEGIKAKFMVPWGQSEDPESPHYLDLVDDYVNYNFREFPFTDDEIAAAEESRTTLR